MDNPFHEQGSQTQQASKHFLVSLPSLGLGNLIKWLVSLIEWTEEEEAGIYRNRSALRILTPITSSDHA